MDLSANDPTPFVTALARQRQQVTREASSVIDGRHHAPGEGGHEAVARLSALLATTLEELKVVEEEMLLQHEDLSTRTSAVELELQFYRHVFRFAPAPLIVTDAHGTIREVNDAAVALVRRHAEHLVSRPLALLVPREERAAFRAALGRLTLTTSVVDWSFNLARPTDTPLPVAAAAQVLPGALGPAANILWSLRPRQGSEGRSESGEGMASDAAAGN